MTKLTLIGAGNMAYAIASGLVARDMPAANITATDAHPPQLEKFRALGANTSASNVDAAGNADIILLAVKPGVVAEVAAELRAAGIRHPVISVAAGITTTSLGEWLGHDQVVRCMPNTPALVREGMIGLYATPGCPETVRDLTGELLSAVGQTRWFVEEGKLDAVTAVSGSGPAYFFLLMEAMQDAARALGLSDEEARQLVSQTAIGAARMAAEAPEPVAQLRANVTSPGGTTAAALDVFEASGFRETVDEALKAACERSIELSRPV